MTDERDGTEIEDGQQQATAAENAAVAAAARAGVATGAGAGAGAAPIDLALRLAALALLIYWAGVLIAPFAAILIWSAILAVALAPLHRWLAARLGGRMGLAAGVITVIGLAIVLGPVAALVASLTGTALGLMAGLRDGTLAVPPPPPGARELPLVGERLHQLWSAAANNLSSFLEAHADAIIAWINPLVGSIIGIGGGVLAFAVAVVVAGFLFRHAVAGQRFLDRSAERIVSGRGRAFVAMSGATIRNVSRGVVGISALQAVLVGAALIVAGVPAAGLLTVGVLLLGIVQVGPGILLIGILIWSWSAMATLPALLLTLYLVPVGLLDNVLKPIVMAKGLDTPMLVVLVGVIGGTLAHGLIGLFIGPIVLAVAYDLLIAWIGGAPDSDDSTA